MTKARFTWHGPEVFASIQATTWERLQRCVVFYHTKLLEALNVSNPSPYRTPSRPGEAPRKRTGTLQRNVLYELDRKAGKARVGVSRSAIYGLFLELGTARMQPRPWLVATFQRLLPQLKRIAGGS